MTLGRGGMFGDPRTEQEKEMERRLLGGLLQPDTQQAVDTYAAMPQGLLAEPEQPQGFWQGGEKFGVREGLAGLLAGVGDGLQNYYGGNGRAMDSLLSGRMSAMEMARKKAEEQAQLAQRMAIVQRAFPGMTGGQQEAIVSGIGNPSDFAPPQRKGLRPVAGPTGVVVWDADNEQFASPRGGVPGMTGMDEWEDISEEEATRARGGPGGNRPGGFRPR